MSSPASDAVTMIAVFSANLRRCTSKRRDHLNLAPLFAGRGRKLRAAKFSGEGPGTALNTMKGFSGCASCREGFSARKALHPADPLPRPSPGAPRRPLPAKSGARLERDAAPPSDQLIDPRALARRQCGQKRRLRRARTAGIGVRFYLRRLRLARLRHRHRG